MPGLMETLVAGGMQGFSNATQQNNAVEIANLNRQADFSIRELMDQRVAERAAKTDQVKYDRGRKDTLDDQKTAQSDKMAQIAEQGKWHSKSTKDPVDNEMKKFTLEQAKRKDAAMQEWNNLSSQYDNAKDEETKEYLYPLLRSVESKLSSMGVNPRGTISTEIKEDPLSGEQVEKSIAKKGMHTPAPAVRGLPAGAKQIGTSGGKPVYQTPDGKKFIGD